MSDDELAIRRLWLALITNALFDYVGLNLQSRPTISRLLKHAAKAWIFSPRNDLGSFVFCCHISGLDPSALRDRVLKLGDCGLKKRLARVHIALTLFRRHGKESTMPIGRPRKSSLRRTRTTDFHDQILKENWRSARFIV